MSEHIHKRHNKNLLLYHLVCPIKYRRSVLSKEVEISLVEVCKKIEERFEINFVEIRADENHVHFLIQSVPMLSVKTIAQTVKVSRQKNFFDFTQKLKSNCG